MKILYLGLPLGALMLHREGHALAAACVSRPELPGMRRLRRAMALRGAPLLARADLAHAAVQELLASCRADLVVSWFWTKRIPPEVVARAPLGGINLHPSLLPRHRGPDPYFWTLLRGDRETGVTAHRIAPGYDEGAILQQRAVPVPPEVSAWQLARRLDRPSLELLRDVVRAAAEGGLWPGVPQDEAAATLAPEPSDDDCEILWDSPAAEVLARVRAAAPEPGAFTGYGDDTVVVLAARVGTSLPRGLDPGDVVLTDEGVVVACRGGECVVLTEARREDGDVVLRGRAVAELFPGVGVVTR